MNIQQLLTLAILIWNFIVFIVYGLDKGKAQKGHYRIPEKVLLSLTLCLGGLGAAFGGYFFHHKTRKWLFKLTWMLGIIINAGVFYWIWR